MQGTATATGVRYPFATPDYDSPVELVPGIHMLRVRLPFALDHINLLIVDDGDSWTLVDTGVGNDATRELWERLLAGVFADKPVGRVLVTHFHPDHVGLAGWLCRRVSAPLLMPRTEWLMSRSLSLDDTESYRDAGAALDRLAGLDPEMIRQRRDRGNLYRRSVSPLPPSFQRIAAGDRFRLAGEEWTLLVGEGHAPEQATLYCPARKLLIGADQVLPRISPVVGVWPQTPDADPLGDFIRSLDQYRHLPEDCLVLPAHGRPYEGLHLRLDQLVHHHEERLGRTLALCATPATAERVMRGLFAHRQLTLQDIGFAQAETLAHLNRLLVTGDLRRWVEADGSWRFERA